MWAFLSLSVPSLSGAPSPAPAPIAIAQISPSMRATLTREYEIEVTVQPHPGDAWTRLAKRVTGDAAYWEEIAALNHADENLESDQHVRVPFLMLRPNLQRDIVVTLFPRDKATADGWQHLVVGSRGLGGLRVATAYPTSTRLLLGEQGVDVELVPVSGSVEATPRLGLADAIVDLVSTGSTASANGLRLIGTLLSSQAVLIGGRTAVDARHELVERLELMLSGVVAARRRRYVMMNATTETLPAIRDVRTWAPSAEIDLAVGSWNAALAGAAPYVNRVEQVDAPWLARGDARRGSSLLSAARRWRRRHYE